MIDSAKTTCHPSVFRGLVVAAVTLLMLLGAINDSGSCEAGPLKHWRHRRGQCRTTCRHHACVTRSCVAETAEKPWQPLFDGKSLDGWKVTNFGGEGEVNVEENAIQIAMGSSLSGITYTGTDMPKVNYELRLEARRTQGIDFFCGLTFPVADAHCSFIVAGWAGAVVGLSSIDGRDASDNETTKYMTFKDGQWYRIRVRVTNDRITTWIDDKQIVDQNIKGRKLSIRPEVELSCPLGISTWETSAEIRNIDVRRISD